MADNGTQTMKTFKKHLYLGMVSCLLFVALLELGLRIFFAFRVGPDLLLYGFVDPYRRVAAESSDINQWHSVQFHDNEQNGYSKYIPHQKRTDFDILSGDLFDVHINSRGFRGREFSLAKPNRTIRVITLGASSTFGYSDRDDETYPYYLEKDLNAQCARGPAFEVVNMGIPHLTSTEIKALFLNEALPANPDVVTYYEGQNDSVGWEYLDESGNGIHSAAAGAAAGSPATSRSAEPSAAWLKRVYGALREHLLTVKIANTFRPMYNGRVTRRELDRLVQGKAARVTRNLQAINNACINQGILFVVMTQQAKADNKVSHERGITYQMEVDGIRRKLDTAGSLSWDEARLLVHSSIMDGVREWARDQGVVLVDVIEAMNMRRDCLVTRVHLSPEGNRIVAQALAVPIAEKYCGQPAGTTGND